MKVCSVSSIGSQPGLVPSSSFRTKFRYGKIRLVVKIERRAGIVTIASGKARLKRRPRAAMRSTFGVCTYDAPYAPTWSGRRLSMISSRTFIGPPAPVSSMEQPAFGSSAAPAAPAAPAWRNRRRFRRIGSRRQR